MKNEIRMDKFIISENEYTPRLTDEELRMLDTVSTYMADRFAEKGNLTEWSGVYNATYNDKLKEIRPSIIESSYKYEFGSFIKNTLVVSKLLDYNLLIKSIDDIRSYMNDNDSKISDDNVIYQLFKEFKKLKNNE